MSEVQTINFQGTDLRNTYPIDSSVVQIISSDLSSVKEGDKKASDKVTVTPAVTFSWEHCYYYGQVVASHRCGYITAYSIRTSTSTASMVRIFNAKTTNKVLLKNFAGRVIDLSFAYTDEMILAIVDDTCAIQVILLVGEPKSSTPTVATNGVQNEAQKSIEYYTIFKVDSLEGSSNSFFHRVIWCPYIPDSSNKDEDECDSSAKYLLAASHGTLVEIFQLNMLRDVCASKPNGTLSRADLRHESSYYSVREHSKQITDLALSPDGCALATASLDGHVYFYNVEFFSEGSSNVPMTRVFDWQPHGGLSVYSLLFLDDRRSGSNCPLWYSVVTGSEYNREVKLWRCDEWVCLQTIRFAASPKDVNLPALQLKQDLSAKFLVLSDIKRTVLYTVEIGEDETSIRDGKGARTRFLSISEFLLTTPCISFSVISACKSPRPLQEDQIINNSVPESDEEENNEDSYISIRLTTVHLRNLQTMVICYPIEATTHRSIEAGKQDSYGFHDGLSDLSGGSTYRANGVANDLVASSSLTQVSPHTSVMMTPGSSHDLGLLTNSHSEKQHSLLDTGSTSASNPDLHQTIRSPGPPRSLEPKQTDMEKDISTGLVGITSGVSTPRSDNGPSAGGDHTLPGHNQFRSLDPAAVSMRSFNDTEADIKRQSCDTEDWPQAPTVAMSTGRTPIDSECRPEDDYMDEEGTATEQDSNGDDEEDEDEEDEEDTHISGDGPRPEDLENEDEEYADSSSRLGTTLVPPESVAAAPISDLNMLVPPVYSRRTDNQTSPTAGRHNFVGSSAHSVSSGFDMNLLWDKLNSQEKVIEKLLINSVAEKDLINDLKIDNSSLTHELNALRTANTELYRLIQQRHEESTKATNALSAALSRQISEMHVELNRKMGAISQDVTKTVAPTIQSTLHSQMQQEVKKALSSNINKITDPIRADINRQVQDKLGAMENVVKDHVVKVVTNKTFVDSIAQSVSHSIQGPLINAYRDSMQNKTIPAIDTAVNKMFAEMGQLYQSGFRQIATQINQQVDQSIHKVSEAQSSAQITWQAQQTAERRREQESQTNALTTSLKTLQDQMGSLTANVEELKDLNKRNRPSSETPQNSKNIDQTRNLVFTLLKKGDVGKAFNEALTSTHLPLLVELCGRISARELFSMKPLPLQQNVILSLLQQLTRDLYDNTQLKIEYTSEALWRLDARDPSIAEHSPRVIQTIHKRIKQFRDSQLDKIDSDTDRSLDIIMLKCSQF